MIYTLTLNPSIDYHISLDTLLAGGLNRASTEFIRVGGKGINVSLMLKKLGIMSTALGFIGGFTGEEIRRQLHEKGIKEDFIEVPGQCSRINVKIHPFETQINGQGISVSGADLFLFYKKLEALSSEDVLIMSGAPCRGLDENIYKEIMDRVSDRGIKVILDTSGPALKRAMAAKPFLVKPNIEELTELYREEITAKRIKAMEEGADIRQLAGISKDDVIGYARRLQKEGARNVLVSMGPDGAVLLADDGNVYEEAIPQITDKHDIMISTVGAGDSLVAGFAAEYFYGSADPAQSLAHGVRAGTETALGGGLYDMI